MQIRGVVNRHHASFGTMRQKVQFLPPRLNMKETEKETKIKQAKTLIKTGAFVSGVGAITIVNALITQHGELGPVGLLIGATGVTMILTGARRKI